MPPSIYAAKLAQILDFNPTWAYGSAGGQTQYHMLGKILSSNLEGEKGLVLMEAALNIAVWSWQERPLDPDLLRLMGVLVEAGANLGAVGAAVCEINKTIHLAPLEHKTYDRALESSAEVFELFWAKLPEFPLKNILKKRYQAQHAVEQGRGEAEGLILALPDNLFADWKALALLELARRRGEDSFEPAIFKNVWANNFWHTNLTLVLYDLLYPMPDVSTRIAEKQGLPPILLYSWNKRDVLASTLDSLRESGTNGAPVFVLDNGSNDGCGDMLRQKKENWNGPFNIIDLPSNIGAPAARNWLLTVDGVKNAPWVVFLDDDVILKKAWLQGLMNVAAAKPDFGAIGCRVTDHIPPYGIQAADFHLLTPGEATRSFEDLSEEIFPFCPAMGESSETLYAYTRPCASVTGCCHLLNMRAIASAGPFNVRFNPSQFDDLERDLRSTLEGFPTYYSGQVVIRHVQHSSLRQAISPQQQAHIMGNKIKLEFLMDKRQSSNLRTKCLQKVVDDLVYKTGKVQDALGL